MSGLTHPLQILLVMADPRIADGVSTGLTSAGHTVTTVFSAAEAKASNRRDAFDVVVTDAALEDEADGVTLAEDLLAEPQHPEVIVLAEKPDIRHAVALTKAGAFDYQSYPISQDKLRAVIESTSPAPAQEGDEEGFDDFLRAFMVSSAPAVQEMAALCRAVASKADATALIIGDTGAGKGVVSRIIHWLSPQARAPLVRINLVDLDPESVERKLFGTGSGEDGLLATARHGTLVIREFSEIVPELQKKLETLIETRTYRPMGGDEDQRFEGRLIATSTMTVEDLVSEALVDPGLAYRLASVSIHVPPLRDRVDDMPRITDAVLSQVASDASRPDLHLTTGARQVIIEHPWVGNLRELRNVLTRIALLCPNDEIDSDDLAQALGFASAEARRSHRSGIRARIRSTRRPNNSSVPVPRISGLIAAALDESARAERERIEAALEAADGHRERAAADLGMSRTTLWTRMRMLGIDYDRFHPRAKAQ